MPDNEHCFSPRRTPWNKGNLIGAKRPLRPKHVWSIRTRLLIEGRTRDLALFNLAIDSKLRGCHYRDGSCSDNPNFDFHLGSQVIHLTRAGEDLAIGTRHARLSGSCSDAVHYPRSTRPRFARPPSPTGDGLRRMRRDEHLDCLTPGIERRTFGWAAFTGAWPRNARANQWRIWRL